jgi:threonine aldolase
MEKSFVDVVKATKYKLSGNGARNFGALMEAFKDMDTSTSSDVYGAGAVINDFEEEVAKLLEKEKAVFFPSGTMAQQIALRIWSDRLSIDKVAYHPLCHLEIHEQDGLKVLHNLKSILLGESSRLFTLEDLKAVEEPIATLLIELPQREIGGQLPSYEELAYIAKYCKAKGIKLHLDGARLFEALPYYNKTAAEICSLFDSVYVSFYKGLGGIAGAVLAGSSDFIEESKIWKRRQGGDLISLYPYIVSAKYNMDKRLGKMKQYWEHASEAAERFNKIKGIKTVPEIPVCNMFHLHIDHPKETIEKILIKVMESTDVALIQGIRELSLGNCKTELSFGDSFELVPQEVLDKAFRVLETEFNNL